MKIRKIFKEISFNSYISELDVKNTILAMNDIYSLIREKITKKYNTYFITTSPLFYNKTQINESYKFFSNKKIILADSSPFLVELPHANRKKSLIQAYNIDINENECLFNKGYSYQINNSTTDYESLAYEKITLTIKGEKAKTNNENFSMMIDFFNELIIKIEKIISNKYKLRKENIKNDFSTHNINELIFSNFSNYIDSISQLFNSNDEMIYLNKFNSKNINLIDIIQDDVYDFNYFVQAYRLNNFLNIPLKIMEISKCLNVKTYLRQNKMKSNLNNANYFWTFLNSSNVENYFQIEINLTNLYLVILNKIHPSEVLSSVWSDDILIKLKNNKIKIL